MFAAIGALAILTVNVTGQVSENFSMQPYVPSVPSDARTASARIPSTLVLLVNADGSPAGELRSSKIPSRVEVQVFEEDSVTDSQVLVRPEEKPHAQSYIWMQDLAMRMLQRALDSQKATESRSHPYSSISGIDRLVIVREVTEEEANSTVPAEQRAERAITGILGG